MNFLTLRELWNVNTETLNLTPSGDVQSRSTRGRHVQVSQQTDSSAWMMSGRGVNASWIIAVSEPRRFCVEGKHSTLEMFNLAHRSFSLGRIFPPLMSSLIWVRRRSAPGLLCSVHTHFASVNTIHGSFLHPIPQSIALLIWFNEEIGRSIQKLRSRGLLSGFFHHLCCGLVAAACVDQRPTTFSCT